MNIIILLNELMMGVRDSETSRLTVARAEAERRLAEVIGRIDIFRCQIKDELSQSLTDYLRAYSEDPKHDYQTCEHKDCMVITVNSVMNRLGMAIDHQGGACYLATYKGKEFPHGRFLLIPHGSKKPIEFRVHLYDFMNRIGPLTLAPRESPVAAPRQSAETPTTWQERVQEQRASKQPHYKSDR